MKICQVLAGRGAGGLERHFVELCNHLAERHEVVAVAHPEFRTRLRAEVVHEGLDLTGWRYNPRSVLALLRCLRRHRPQIVHAQANKAAAMVAAVRFGLGDARRVATVHNLKRNNRAFRSFHRVIAVSRRTARQITHGRVDVIYNGIAAPATPTRDFASGASPPGPIVLSVGRLVPAKGFDVLLRAWVDIEARLFIAGEGPERHRLEKLIDELGLAHKVGLLGFRPDASALVSGADVVVIASRKEGFSYVFAEALCARRVVIATRVPVADEVLPDDFLVAPDDAAALHAKIVRVLNAPHEARAALEPLWRQAQKEFTIERMVAETENVYRLVSGG